MPAFRLGAREYVYLALSLAALSLLIWPLLAPAFYHEWCIRSYIPSMHTRFGFRAEHVTLPGESHPRLKIVDVVPDGLLSRAGFRAGDVPVDYHGGETAFCGALQRAEDGLAAEVYVIHVDDMSQGWTARRTLTIGDETR